MNRLLQQLLPLRYTYFHPKYQRFIKDFRLFSRLSAESPQRFRLEWKDRYPFLDDRLPTLAFPPDYTYFPAWAARILAATRPSMHVDISSTLHFCTIVSAFVPTEFYEFRPAPIQLEGLQSKKADLMALPFPTGAVASISCMHVVEHVGLGRYGDPIDPQGDLKAMAELVRVLAKGGALLFVVPVGRPAVRFNAHRIYSYEQVVSYFPELRIRQFALVEDSGTFSINADPTRVRQQSYGCGCWWFEK